MAGKGIRLAAFRRNKGIKSKDDQTVAPGINLIYETDRQTGVAYVCLSLYLVWSGDWSITGGGF